MSEYANDINLDENKNTKIDNRVQVLSIYWIDPEKICKHIKEKFVHLKKQIDKRNEKTLTKKKLLQSEKKFNGIIHSKDKSLVKLIEDVESKSQEEFMTRSKSLEQLINKFIQFHNLEQYNNTNPHCYSLSKKNSKDLNKDKHYKMKSYFSEKTIIPTLSKELRKGNKKLAVRSHQWIIFFYNTQTIIVATTAQAWRPIKPLVNYEFPFKVINHIGDANRIINIIRQSLLDGSREELKKVEQDILHKVSSLYHMVESITCALDKNSELYELLNEVSESDQQNESSSVEEPQCKKMKMKNKDIFVKMSTSGLIRVFKRLSFESIYKVLKLFAEYMKKLEPNKKFNSINILDIDPSRKGILDKVLIENIFEQFQNKGEQNCWIAHKYVELLISHDDLKITIPECGEHETFREKPKHITWATEDLNPVDINNILEKINENDKDKFIYKIRNGKIQYTLNGQSTSQSILNCIEGEIFYQGEKTANTSIGHYFKIRNQWRQVKADYVCLLQQNFEKVMQEVFITDYEAGRLPLSWNAASSKPVTEKCFKNILSDENACQKFFQKIEEMEVSFIEITSQVNQNKLVGQILEVGIIKKHQKEIELALKRHSKGANIRETIKSSTHCSDNEVESIFAALSQKMPIVTENEIGKTVVINPLNLYWYDGNKKKELEKQLKKSYTHRDEEDYNRSYLYNDECEDYLVFDQIILRDGIEVCDILKITKDKLYLYHVKPEFGNATRAVCSQILNSASLIQDALNNNEPNNYLYRLWDYATKDMESAGGKWRNMLRTRLLKLGQQNFIHMFQKKNIVFVYAYLPGPYFENIKGREKLKPEQIQLCKKLGFINQSGHVTEKFVYINSEQFVKDLRKDSEITIERCTKIYQIISDSIFSKSILAKMEILRTEHILKEFQKRFTFRICEIPQE